MFYKLLTAGFNNGSDSNVAQDSLCTTQDGGFQYKPMSKNEQKNLNVTKLFKRLKVRKDLKGMLTLRKEKRKG